MTTRFLPSGRVEWFPSSEFDGADRFASRLTGQTTRVSATRRIVAAGSDLLDQVP